MGIEVRQMVVKSNVLQRKESAETDSAQDQEETRKAILDECKRLIQEAIQEVKER